MGNSTVALLALIVLLEVSTATPTFPLLKPLGIVEGITDCGSSGRLGRVTVTDCTVTPCYFIPDSVYDVTIRFTASVTTSTLRLQIHEAAGGFLLLEFPINGEIQAGIEYETAFQLPIHADWSGAAFDIIFYILDYDGASIEVCARAAIIIT